MGNTYTNGATKDILSVSNTSTNGATLPVSQLEQGGALAQLKFLLLHKLSYEHY